MNVKLDPIVASRIDTLGARDRQVVAGNIDDLIRNPACGHPSFLSRAKKQAWQHVCPSAFVLLYRWKGADPTHPDDLVTVEDVVDRF